ncbi:probable tyrosyl-DNA phosphodiesterase isoform X2 [Sipha flava]|uniref:Probable tyrosyl-DNA phosphodiesterase isoform X2 n=1 Tax=Sipha flava TaxID=143950 RepID=A0A8B8FKT4_9HEMI|nr:probable tyrosyl-DNA phosphodiesterase isoform X2 [Sipha flava]
MYDDVDYINPNTGTDNVWQHTKGNVNKKLERAEPYRFFLSPVDCDPSTHVENLTLSFAELLDKSLGDLEESLHINLIINLKWLYEQYRITGQKDKISILFHSCDYELDELKKIPNLSYKQLRLPNLFSLQQSNFRFKQTQPQNQFYSHHSKLSMFAYSDGSIRIVVMTGNLRKFEFTNITQGFWVSPKFPLKNEDDKSDGDSKTGFKKDILRYLNSYNNIPLLRSWIQKIEKADFSEANVFFIPSIPGKHLEPMWGHQYLKYILKTHACIPFGQPSDWPIISQVSSLGIYGDSYKNWLLSELVESFSQSTHCSTDKAVNFNIFPTMDNILNSWDGPVGGSCVLYCDEVHQKQTWLKNYMRKWVSNSRNRSKAVPHIKTYCRISPCNTEMSWFLLTSANLSKTAWGKKLWQDRSYTISAFEVGVLFLPQFLTGCNTFSLNQKQNNGRSPPFPLHFDLPLSPYSSTDQPWRVDALDS